MHLVKLLIFIIILGLAPTVSFARDAYNTDVRYLHVQKGQTLHNIVKQLYPNREKQWPKIINDIVRQNPHAFLNNDPTQMKAGVRLTLPQKVVVRSEPVKPVQSHQVGVVVESSGRVVAVDKAGVSRILSRGYPVFLGDKVVSGESGSVRFRMIDEAILDLGCYSIMVIEDYALNTSNRKSILNLLQGSLKKITGKIGKMTEDVYQLKTPLASVGVRGTEYALRVFQTKGCGGTIDADDGLYLEVIKGLVDVTNEAGHEVIAKGETAYVPLPKAVPRKVKIKPGVIRPAVVIEPVVETHINEPEEESSSFWWWILGIVGIALLI
jgi:hypothetical protein